MTFDPTPGRLLSLAEWDSLPDDPDGHRYELSRGVLVVVPPGSVRHQLLTGELPALLNRQLPATRRALPGVAVVLDAHDPPTLRIPDVVVLPTTVLRRAVAAEEVRVDAADVVLAVEVLSPGTTKTDRFVKFGQYADAGIPHYWIIDPRPPVTLSAFSLVDGEYEVTADGAGTLHLLSPAELDIDLDALANPDRPARRGM